YEEPAEDDDSEPQQRIEIIHESLLSNWPRLVRWRTQDADSAQLKDQLRQAAQMWIERGRPEDLLWTGTSYKEYELWRERYEGGLSESEETFARAMKTKAEHQKRQRRQRVVLAFAALALVTIVISLLGWQAHLGQLRAEAQKLVALGQLEFENSPTTSLAYATTSLKLLDNEEARLLAQAALSKSPPVTAHPLQAKDSGVAHRVTFSPDGSWVVLSDFEGLQALSRDGQSRRVLERFPSGTIGVEAVFDQSGEMLYGAKDGEIRIWSAPDFELLERQTTGGAFTLLASTAMGVICLSEVDGENVFWSVEHGRAPEELGRIGADGLASLDFEPRGLRMAYSAGNRLLIRSIREWDVAPREIGTHRDSIRWIKFHPLENRVLAYDKSGEIRIWSTESERDEPLRVFESQNEVRFVFDPTGRRLVGYKSLDRLDLSIWNLDAPAEALPTRFGAGFLGTALHNGTTFSPDGRWIATAQVDQVGFWPVARTEPYTLEGHGAMLMSLEFTRDGQSLVARDITGRLTLWPLSAGAASRTLAEAFSSGLVAVDPLGRFVATADTGGALVVPLDGAPTMSLEGFDPTTWVVGIAIDPTGRYVAASPNRGPASDKFIRIWDLETGEVTSLGPLEEAGDGFDGQTIGLTFLPGGALLSAGDGGLQLWNLRTGQSDEILGDSLEGADLEIFGGGRFVAHILSQLEGSQLAITDLETRSTRILPEFGGVGGVAVDPTGTVIATAGSRGIQVRLISPGAGGSDEPHLLLGHEAWQIAISPDGRQIASGSADGTIRIWPMPDLSKRPLHTLPRGELLDKLSTLTNLQVVEDEASSTGWKVETGPFPGWEVVPTW
ncbi:MAG: hypothetical protein P8Y44_02820, partial [Acidobacteriota bacterium]